MRIFKQLVVPATALAIACSGGSGGSPTGPTQPAGIPYLTPGQTWDYHEPEPVPNPEPAPPDAMPPDAGPPLTVADIAVSLGAEINSSFMKAMQAGVPMASREPGGRQPSLLALLESLISVPVYAQGTGFVANCSRGGNVRIQYLGAAPQGGRVTLVNTPVTLTGCTHVLRGRDVTAHGTLMGNGTWTYSAPTSPVRLSGDVTADGVGVIGIDGSTGAAFQGTVGGVFVGPPDTPPPPNPTPAPCTIGGVPVPCPAPTPTPAPTAINVTGAWGDSSGTTAAVLQQNGGSITGSLSPLPPIPAGNVVVTNTLSGTIVGSTVNLTGVLVLRSSAAGITITTTSTTRYTFQVIDNNTMSGTSSTTATAVCSGSEFCPPPVTTSGTWSGIVTRR